MRPAPGLNWLIRFCTWLNGLAGYIAFLLPVAEAILQETEHLTLPSQVGFRGGPVVPASAFLALPIHITLDPADAVKPLLEDIVRAGNQVVVFPHAQVSANQVDGGGLASPRRD